MGLALKDVSTLAAINKFYRAQGARLKAQGQRILFDFIIKDPSIPGRFR
jgi:hypothetical protein